MDWEGPLLRQWAEDGYPVGGADEDFSVGDHGRDEFVAGAELVAVSGGLIAVVKLVQIRGIVGV